jgi:hypothetical protein
MGLQMTHATTSWLAQINFSGYVPYGLRIEDVLIAVVFLLLYVGFEIIHNVELMETKEYEEEKRRARLGRLTGN